MSAPRAAGSALTVLRTRGECVETVSEVRAALVDVHGRLLESWGEELRVPARSCAKFLQALPLLTSGAADAFGLDQRRLALSCASHGGEDGHAAAVLDWLAELGLGEADLQCGAALPMDRAIADAHLAAGGARSRARHNCSGKHAGFLTLGAQLGADPADYLEPGGAVQQQVLAAVQERCAVRLAARDIAVDGCGAPAVCLTLAELARGLGSLLGAGPGTADAALVDAAAAQPWLLAGTGRLDTAIAQATDGRVLSKVGADGMQVALVRDQQLALAVKCVSGDGPAAQVALLALLGRIGALSQGVLAAELTGFARPPVLDDAHGRVGELRLA